MSDLVIFSPGEEWASEARLAKEPAVDLEPVEARGRYTFHRGHFQTRLAYVRHPHYASYLVPYNEFNEFVLVDKYNEVLRVMSALGASTVDCTSYRARSRGRQFRAIVSGNGFRGGQEARSSSTFDYHHEGAGSPARDPRPLRWPGEPGIESAIDAVLQNHATIVRITISREAHLSTNGEITGTLKKLGVDLGLSTGNSQVDTLKFEALFPPDGSRARRLR